MSQVDKLKKELDKVKIKIRKAIRINREAASESLNLVSRAEVAVEVLKKSEIKVRDSIHLEIAILNELL